MKGREKSVIFLPAFEDEVMPGNSKGEELAESLRLAYVAVTRAKLEVHMSYCTERPNDYKPWQIESGRQAGLRCKRREVQCEIILVVFVDDNRVAFTSIFWVRCIFQSKSYTPERAKQVIDYLTPKKP